DRVSPRGTGNGHAGAVERGGHLATLEVTLSAALREELLSELGTIRHPDEAAQWARKRMASKNALATEDAKAVESAFERMVRELAAREGGGPAGSSNPTGSEQVVAQRVAAAEPVEAVAQRIDKSGLTVAAPRRLRNKEHLRHVARQPC